MKPAEMFSSLLVPEMPLNTAIKVQQLVWLLTELNLLSVPAGLGFGLCRVQQNLIADGRDATEEDQGEQGDEGLCDIGGSGSISDGAGCTSLKLTSPA